MQHILVHSKMNGLRPPLTAPPGYIWWNNTSTGLYIFQMRKKNLVTYKFQF